MFPAAAHMQATRQTNKPSIRNITALTNTIKSPFVGVRLRRWGEGWGKGGSVLLTLAPEPAVTVRDAHVTVKRLMRPQINQSVHFSRPKIDGTV